MIFILRMIIFSTFVYLGFNLALQSIEWRKVVSAVYIVVLVWYTFLCRIPLILNVEAADYEVSYGLPKSETVLRVLEQVFGMESQGYIAKVSWQAFILNILLFVPMGFLTYMWISDWPLVPLNRSNLTSDQDMNIKDSTMGVKIDKGERVGDENQMWKKRSYPGNRVLIKEKGSSKKSFSKFIRRGQIIASMLVCFSASLIIETVQKLTSLGYFDVKDLIANTIGGAAGVVVICIYIYTRRGNTSRV